jgi:NDP-sugar pyrophosphorylase family protein
MMTYCGFNDGAGWANNLCIEAALKHGALGAKLTGAGGGGSVFALVRPGEEENLTGAWEQTAREAGLTAAQIYRPHFASRLEGGGGIMQGIILAAGKGSRLQQITLTRSKAMLPILGKPIVERVMLDLFANGVEDFVLVVSPDDRDITHYFRAESELEAEVRFVYQPQRLGMANALACAAPLITGDFILSACDNLVSAEHVGRMIDSWQWPDKPDAVLTLMQAELERVGETGVVEMDGPWIKRIVEKPLPGQAPSGISSLPLYCFSPRILDYVPDVRLSTRGEYELQDAIQMLIDRAGRVGGVMCRRRLTLTNAADLLALNHHYLTQGVDRPQLAPQTVGPNTQLITPLHIEKGTVIGGSCVIGPNVYIERDCRIGEGVTVRNAVILRRAILPDRTTVADQVVS